jgi:hypothetical protein
LENVVLLQSAVKLIGCQSPVNTAHRCSAQIIMASIVTIVKPSASISIK